VGAWLLVWGRRLGDARGVARERGCREGLRSCYGGGSGALVMLSAGRGGSEDAAVRGGGEGEGNAGYGWAAVAVRCDGGVWGVRSGGGGGRVLSAV